MNNSTFQRALSITKWSTKKGWSDDEFWEAIELLRSLQETKNPEEPPDDTETIYNQIQDYPIMLKAEHISIILGISLRKSYEIMEQEAFPLIRIGRKKTVLKEEFFNWLKK
ncbi:DNA-binding protein [Bacillus paranthracis]|uniref:DNA-binding protein n=1 Tax=Bacillus paranthracis TaxID=2026186 RepID=UPI001E583785|nr:DNA-binding protein [Bacillus paranthracis]MCC2430690.1 DNA-binding protein [Bacillus paranthracis]